MESAKETVRVVGISSTSRSNLRINSSLHVVAGFAIPGFTIGLLAWEDSTMLRISSRCKRNASDGLIQRDPRSSLSWTLYRTF